MHIRFYRYILFILSGMISVNAYASENHGVDTFHMFKAESDVGVTQDKMHFGWDVDGWIGNDQHKLWLKLEGEKLEGEPSEQSEFWAMYSYNMATFWDVQVGLRFDEQPKSVGYMVVGVDGLAPYFIETKAHLFISEYGDVSARVHQGKELLLTQKLITEPYLELNFFAQDVPELDVAQGLGSGEFGIKTRYEITRKFAPYFDIRYDRKFGETSVIARDHGERKEDVIANIGIRVMF